MDDLPITHWLARLLDTPNAALRAAAVIAAAGGHTRLLTSPPRLWIGPEWLTTCEAERLEAALQLATHLLRSPPPAAITEPTQVLRLCADLARAPVEQLWLLTVDAGLRPGARLLIARGGRAGCALDTIDVLRPAVLHGACGIFLVHNHPSGDPTPSGPDRRFTERVARGAARLDVKLHDHLVLAGARWASCVTAARGAIEAHLSGPGPEISRSPTAGW